MSLNPRHLLERVIRPALRVMGNGYASEAAERLVLGTAIVESGLQHLVQLGSGPAVGLWQMEPATYRDHWRNGVLARDADLASRVLSLASRGSGDIPSATEMIGNLPFAAAMCRVHYLRDPHKLPDALDTRALAATWKRVYNTPLGAGTEQRYLDQWAKHAGSLYG